MSFFGIIVPEAGTNLVANPSVELNTTGYTANNGTETLSRLTSFARFGIYSLFTQTSANTNVEGWLYPGTGTNGIAVSASMMHSFYVWIYQEAASNSLQLKIDWYTAAGAFISSHTQNITTVVGRWAKFSLTAAFSPATAAFATLKVVEQSGSATAKTWWSDGINFVALEYALTHIDGDQPGCRWTGLRHASTSTLDAQERSGGRERDLTDDFGIGVLRQYPGVGMPPVTNNVQPLALQPGALFQSSKVGPRVFDLHVDVEGTTYENMHKKRKDFIDLIKPDRTRGGQPATLVFKGSAKKATIQARYDGGAEFGQHTGFDEQPVIRLLCVDPFWQEDNQEVASLDFQDSVSNAARGLRRHAGQWKALGTGFNARVNGIAVDFQRGRIYFVGDFTTANGVTVNRVTYWDGTTFIAMGTGADLEVLGIALAPNGDVWIVGAFDNVNAVASHGIARWNVSASTWTQFALGPADFNAVVIAKTGRLYAGGNFINWNADPASDFIVQFDGSIWSAVGTSPFGATDYPQRGAMAIDTSDNLYVGTQVGIVRKWNGSAWSTIGTAAGGNVDIWSIYVASDGTIYVGGDYTSISSVSANNIASYNGSAWSPLGSGVNAAVFSIRQTANGLFIVGGNFTSAGGLALGDRIAGWNGSTWVHLDADLPGSPGVLAVATLGDDIYIGFDTTGTATAAGLTTVTNNGTTEIYPIVTIIGPSSGSCTVQWLENQSTKQRWYLNLVVQTGETVTLDTLTGKVDSDFRGRIYDQPLGGSDSFKLLPGANTVAAFVTGTITGVSMLLRWIPRHWSVDGVAV